MNGFLSSFARSSLHVYIDNIANVHSCIYVVISKSHPPPPPAHEHDQITSGVTKTEFTNLYIHPTI